MAQVESKDSQEAIPNISKHHSHHLSYIDNPNTPISHRLSNHSIASSSQSSYKLKEYLKDKTYLFYCPSMKDVAMQISKKSNGSVVLGDIEFSHFNDGFPNLRVRGAFNIRYCEIAFLADLSDPKNIFEQYAGR